MKDTLLVGLFGLGVVLSAYLAGSSLFAWAFWDIAMYNPEVWHPIARALFGVVTAFILWVSLCFAADDLSYKDKYSKEYNEHTATKIALNRTERTYELALNEITSLRTKEAYESPYRCRYTGVRIR